MADLNVEYHERTLLENQKRFYKRSGRVGLASKLLDKSKETCFACGKLGYFQKECPSSKTSTPFIYPQTGLKAEIAILTKRIDDMTKGKSKKGKKEKDKSKKCLISESVDWDYESVSLDDEGITKIRAFMAIFKDEPLVGKVDAMSGQWDDITMKKAGVKKSLSKLKAQSPLKPTPMKTPMIPKPFKKCKYCGFNDHHYDHIKNLNEVTVNELRSNNETEFRNHKLEEFYDEKGEAVNTAYYTQNRSIILKKHRKTSNDVFRGRSPDIGYFYMFRCLIYIHNHKDHLGKFDEKAYNEFFLGYSPVTNTFKVYNIRREELEETIHVTFSEDDEAVSQSNTKGDAINFNEYRSFPDDEFLKLKSEVTQCLIYIHNHKDHLGKFDEKAYNEFFLGYSPVTNTFKVYNIRREELEETIHVTFSEDDEAVSQSNTKGDAINFNEYRSFPDDEFLKLKSEVTQYL
nr:hypothetical protein [Tanacetum cinerariifolium]